MKVAFTAALAILFALMLSAKVSGAPTIRLKKAGLADLTVKVIDVGLADITLKLTEPARANLKIGITTDPRKADVIIADSGLADSIKVIDAGLADITIKVADAGLSDLSVSIALEGKVDVLVYSKAGYLNREEIIGVLAPMIKRLVEKE
ncbi:hypothetical protein N9268_03335 [Akkermansiaceae bacterium]|nr:hypothetical protein [Akkermansiaceae bacterium]MDB4421990.1 hypothetical protein [Akkermansiaceae bacterium]MDB4545661.1 hypothetical protein [Akkermansiaceae bacterium]